MTDGLNGAAAAGLIGCHSCNLVSRVSASHGHHAAVVCPRCGGTLHARKPDSLARTWALVIAAGICYVPANLLPIMKVTSLGNSQADTIMSGVIYLLVHGMWPLALVVFIASVFVPLTKLIILVYLLISVQRRSQWRPVDRTRLYRITEAVGRWSMVDIYVVTIMVALVKLGNLASIEAQAGAIFFGAVVVITMIAAMTFDPRLIWDNLESTHDKPAA
jgi:paraquat-inducible protein A